jgi:hypothetical protein
MTRLHGLVLAGPLVDIHAVGWSITDCDLYSTWNVLTSYTGAFSIRSNQRVKGGCKWHACSELALPSLAGPPWGVLRLLRAQHHLEWRGGPLCQPVDAGERSVIAIWQLTLLHAGECRQYSRIIASVVFL